MLLLRLRSHRATVMQPIFLQFDIQKYRWFEFWLFVLPFELFLPTEREFLVKYLIQSNPGKGSVPLRPCVLQCINSYMKNKYQCSKLNTYIVTTFLSEWWYCVNIEIPLRLRSAPTFRALKNMSAVMLHFLIHICEYRMTWSIDHLNIKL